MTSSYLNIVVSSMIGGMDLRFGYAFTATEKFCSFLATVGTIFAITYPVVLLIVFISGLKPIVHSRE